MSIVQKTTAETISIAVEAFNNIGAAISYMGVSTLNKPVQQYPDLIKSIKTNNQETEQLEGYLADVYTAIVDKGGTCTENDYSTYDDGVRSIATTSNEEITQLEGYLSDVYTAIIDKGGTCTENDYSTYDDGVRSISSSSDNEELEQQVNELQQQVNELQSQISELEQDKNNLEIQIQSQTATISTLTGKVNSYESYFDDIYTAIIQKDGECTEGEYDTYADGVLSIETSSGGGDEQEIEELKGYLSDVYSAIINKGGTCEEDNYGTYDEGVTSIPQSINTIGELDRLKQQLSGIDISDNFNNGAAKVINGNRLFADMIRFETLYGKLDLSECIDCTDMFKNCYSGFSTPTITNFGNNSNADLILDFSANNNIDFDVFKNDIAEYTTSPDGTKHIRKILVNSEVYERNVGWGGVAKLASKGITVEIKDT